MVLCLGTESLGGGDRMIPDSHFATNVLNVASSRIDEGLCLRNEGGELVLMTCTVD